MGLSGIFAEDLQGERTQIEDLEECHRFTRDEVISCDIVPPKMNRRRPSLDIFSGGA